MPSRDIADKRLDRKQYLSVSQVNQYARCPYAYFLARREKAWERPAAWLPQGLGFHEAIEFYHELDTEPSLEEVQGVFRESYAKHTNRLAEHTPNLEYWFWSGPYDGEADIERRFKIGLDQVAGYLNWEQGREARYPELIWVDDAGKPGIELAIDVEFGSVPVRGYIDQVVVAEDKGVIVRDLKTGNKPGDEFQLAVYARALEKMYEGLDIVGGDYWMARKSKPTKTFPLTDWTEAKVTDVFEQTQQMIRDEKFDPDPSPDKCRFCSVSYSCEFSQV